jgi:hypothetical protein
MWCVSAAWLAARNLQICQISVELTSRKIKKGLKFSLRLVYVVLKKMVSKFHPQQLLLGHTQCKATQKIAICS